MPSRTDKKTSVLWNAIVLAALLGAAVLLVAPAWAKPAVTIVAPGDQKYYQGEEIILRGTNSDSDTTYLFMTGPEKFMSGPGVPASGGKLTAPTTRVVSGNADSFVRVKTNSDKTWEYAWFTNSIGVDAGSYTVYAVSKPESKDKFSDSTTYGKASVILMKPFITAEASPSSISRGQPFTITGVAEGNPLSVQVVLIGENGFSAQPDVAVKPDANFTFTIDSAASAKLSPGLAYIVVQHSMQDNQFALGVSGDSVRSAITGKNLFKVAGTGSLQGRVAEEAYVAALNDDPSIDDTYTVIPITVIEPAADSSVLSATPVPASVPQDSQPAAAAPVQTQAHKAPLQLAPLGALILLLGIAGRIRQRI